MHNNDTNSLKDYILLVDNMFLCKAAVSNLNFETIANFGNSTMSMNGQVVNQTVAYSLNVRGRAKFNLDDIHSYSAAGNDINYMLQQAVHEKLRFNTYFDTTINMKINLRKRVMYVNFTLCLHDTNRVNEFVKHVLYEVVDNTLLS